MRLAVQWTREHSAPHMCLKQLTGMWKAGIMVTPVWPLEHFGSFPSSDSFLSGVLGI